MITIEEYRERRSRLFDKMEDGSIALLFSGKAKSSTADETYPFEVNRNFYYLTGIDQEECTLMLILCQGERKEFLFVPPYDPVKEKWYGRRLKIEEASELSGIRNVVLNNSLESRLHAELTGSFNDFGSIDKVYLDLSPELKIADHTATTDYAETLKRTFPGVSVYDVYPFVAKLRMVKSPAEIKELREAIRTTGLGIQAIMAAVRPGVKEYELANIFEHVINDDNARNGISFNSIIASGAHSCTLHYPRPMDQLKADDVLLIDVGARHHYYCGDISRTMPINGVFSEQQKIIYSIVLECNKAVASFARPGLTIKELQSFTKEYLASECLAHRLIAKKEDIDKVYFHGVSHHIGLDTHDACDRELPLEPGNVISDEPGLYFASLGIGVRIEDDLLITKKGAEVLSEGIIKEIGDIEAFFANGRRR